MRMLLGKEKLPEILKVYEGKVEVVFSLGFNQVRVGWLKISGGEVEDAELWKSGKCLRGEKALREILSGDFLFRADLSLDFHLQDQNNYGEEWRSAVSSLKGGGKALSREELLKKLGIREPSEEEVDRIIENARE